jgi:hypothetical protein
LAFFGGFIAFLACFTKFLNKTVDTLFYFANYYAGPPMKSHFGVSKVEEL